MVDEHEQHGREVDELVDACFVDRESERLLHKNHFRAISEMTALSIDIREIHERWGHDGAMMAWPPH